MRFKDSNGRYFYFKLEDDDWKKFGYENCKRFLNALQKEIPGGKNGDRYWIAGAKMWAVRKTSRPILNRLIKDYLKINQQKELFNG